jgi:hypothetical protein
MNGVIVCICVYVSVQLIIHVFTDYVWLIPERKIIKHYAHTDIQPIKIIACDISVRTVTSYGFSGVQLLGGAKLILIATENKLII